MRARQDLLRALLFILPLTLATVGLAPGAALAQDEDGDEGDFAEDDHPGWEVDAFLVFGFASDLRVEFDAGGGAMGDVPLDATIGFGARGHLTVLDLSDDLKLGVGGLFRMAFVRGDIQGRQTAADIDGSAVFAWVQEVFSLYGSVAIGLSISGLDDLFGSANTGVGWNVSPMAGIAINLSETFAAFAELGLIHRDVSHESAGLGFNLRHTEFSVQVGARYGRL